MKVKLDYKDEAIVGDKPVNDSHENICTISSKDKFTVALAYHE